MPHPQDDGDKVPSRVHVAAPVTMHRPRAARPAAIQRHAAAAQRPGSLAGAAPSYGTLARSPTAAAAVLSSLYEARNNYARPRARGDRVRHRARQRHSRAGGNPVHRAQGTGRRALARRLPALRERQPALPPGPRAHCVPGGLVPARRAGARPSGILPRNSGSALHRVHVNRCNTAIAYCTLRSPYLFSTAVCASNQAGPLGSVASSGDCCRNRAMMARPCSNARAASSREPWRASKLVGWVER